MKNRSLKQFKFEIIVKTPNMAEEKKTESKFVFFYSNGSPFSQWYPSRFTTKSVVAPQLNANEYNCAEQYMMAEKALLFGDAMIYNKIMAQVSPRKQKALGRKVRGFNESTWKKMRERIVFQASYAKFSQNPELLRKLMATGDKTLVEASPTDRVWGVGMRASDPGIHNPKNWRGLNLLGKALTATRETIKEKQAVRKENDLDPQE